MEIVSGWRTVSVVELRDEPFLFAGVFSVTELRSQFVTHPLFRRVQPTLQHRLFDYFSEMLTPFDGISVVDLHRHNWFWFRLQVNLDCLDVVEEQEEEVGFALEHSEQVENLLLVVDSFRNLRLLTCLPQRETEDGSSIRVC